MTPFTLTVSENNDDSEAKQSREDRKFHLLKTIPYGLALTGRIEDWLKSSENRLPVSCTAYMVEDSMEGKSGIEDSWKFTSQALRNAAGVSIHLTKLRAKGTNNGKGLIASGPCSFGKLYSELNEILRRGGIFKNGAVTLHLNYTHADALEFVNMPRKDMRWAKRCLDVPETYEEFRERFESDEEYQQILIAIAKGDIFLHKITYDKDGNQLLSNVCVAGSSWIQTTWGPKQVKDLVGQAFTAIVDGKEYRSGDKGFWSNGVKEVYKIETEEGYTGSFTGDHRLQLVDNSWKEVSSLEAGDKLKLNDHSYRSNHWDGKGTFSQGWLIAHTALRRILFFLSPSQQSFLSELGEVVRAYTKACCEKDNEAAFSILSSDTANTLKLLLNSFGIEDTSDYRVTEEIESSSSDFHLGFLRGLFDIAAEIKMKDNNVVTLCLLLLGFGTEDLKAIQRMLLRFGITSSLGRYVEEATPEGAILEIEGHKNLSKFNKIIGLDHPTKSKELTNLLGVAKSGLNKSSEFSASFLDRIVVGEEEVFDCTISEANKFDANGLMAHNCLEILVKHLGSCLLAHENLGKLMESEIEAAMENGMRWLCELHKITGAGESGIYLSADEDKQVGLGVLGLANHLAIAEISYANFTRALEIVVGLGDKDNSPIDSRALSLAQTIYSAYQKAANVARSYGMERAFTIAPTASCSFRYRDRHGYTTSPEIAPPIAREVERASGTMTEFAVEYHPDSEIAIEVGWDIHLRLNGAWQKMMEDTGLAHTISMNWWSDIVPMDDKFLRRWFESPVRSLYYALQVRPDSLDKSQIITNPEAESASEAISCSLLEDGSGVDENCLACRE